MENKNYAGGCCETLGKAKTEEPLTELYGRMREYNLSISDYRSLVMRIGDVRRKLSGRDESIDEATKEQRLDTVLGIMNYQNDDFRQLNNRFNEYLEEIEMII